MLKFFIPSLAITILLDQPLRGIIASLKTPHLLKAMGWISYLGKGWVQAIPCLILLLTGLWLQKESKAEEAGRKGIYSISAAGILVQIIKHLIGRPRPRVMDAAGFSIGPSFAGGYDSFPSGHTASAFAFAYTISFFYPKWRFPLFIYAALVGLSRIYIDAHFPSDIFAGMALGLWIGWVVTTKGIDEIRRMVTGKGIVLGIVALSIFLFFYKLGAISLFDVDEAVFAESAREMIETGDWITPQYNYTNRYDKPILFYWLISSAYGLFGVNEFSARFWSATFALTLVILSYYFIRRTGGERWGLLGALILSTSLEVILLSHAAITDMTLTFFISLSLFSFLLGHSEEGRLKAWWYRGFFIALSLAVLTKGPVGLVIPSLVVLLFLFFSGRLVEGVKEMRPLSGILIFSIITLPWYSVEIILNGWEYIDAFFIKHNFTRYTGVISGHSGPVYYFIPVILLTFFPWSIFIPQGLGRSFNLLKGKTPLTSSESLILFSSLWFLVVFLFFSFSKTKLPGYIAPLSPAVAIIVGKIWNDYLSTTSTDTPSGSSEERRWFRISTTFCILLGLSLGIGLILAPEFLENSKKVLEFIEGPVEIRWGFYLLGGGIIAGILLFLIMLWRGYRTLSFVALVFMMIFTTYVIFAHIVPLAERHLQSPLKEFAIIAGAELEKGGGELVIYGLNKPSIVFYARHPAHILTSKEEDRLVEFENSAERVFIISRGTYAESLLDHSNFTLIGRRGYYALLTNRPLGDNPHHIDHMRQSRLSREGGDFHG